MPPIYARHHENLKEFIITQARKLFIEKGLEETTISSVASACHMTRATVYKYFPNKESLLWSIQYTQMKELGLSLHAKINLLEDTGINRYRIYLYELFDYFVFNPDLFLFFDAFDKTYQAGTLDKDNSPYNHFFNPSDFGSKDIVNFLCEKFNDGTLKSNLDPIDTAVSITYTALYILTGMVKHTEIHLLKYGVKPNYSIKLIFDSILLGLAS